MKDDVHAPHLAGNLFPITHIGQKKTDIFEWRKFFFQKKKLALIVVDADKLTNLMVFQQLMDQFPADGAAGAGYEYPFILK